MKKITVFVLVLFALSLFPAHASSAKNEDDLKIIKKAVKKNSKYREGKEVKWLKVLVRDKKAKKHTFKLSLPIPVIDLFAKSGRDDDLEVDCDDCSFDLRELFAELKRLGPTALIEIREGKKLVKVWLE
jgi:hypothetical protein